MSRSVLALALPCPKCGAKSGEACVRLDNKQPRSRSHKGRTPVQPCGSYGGYQSHRKAGETPCEPCREANRRYHAEHRNKHPERREADIAGLLARREAVRLLIARHDDEFRALLAQVKAGDTAEGRAS